MPRSCPLCGTNNLARDRSAYASGRWDLKFCGRCGFLYLENPPPYARLADEFAWERTSQRERARRREQEPLVNALSTASKRVRARLLARDKTASLTHAFVEPGNLLDVGCGWGVAMQRILGHPMPGGKPRWTPYGIEVSPAQADHAKTIFQPHGGDALHADAITGLKHFEDETFSGVIMSSFLEHDVNPLGVLTEARRVVAANGHGIIKTPNFNCLGRRVRGRRWCGFRFPDHVNYFTPASLRKLVMAAGFGIGRFHGRDRFIGSDNMYMVAVKR